MITALKVTTFTRTNLNELMQLEDFIGYESLAGRRYMVVTHGSVNGFAVQPAGTWASKNDQINETKGKYFIFNSTKELYQWLLQDEFIDKN